MTRECSRCGKCCQSIGLGKNGMDKDTLEWARARGLKEEQGFFIVPNICQHLGETKYLKSDFRDQELAKYDSWCRIHDHKPKTCQKFHGQKQRAGKRYYVPPGCTMAEMK